MILTILQAYVTSFVAATNNFRLCMFGLYLNSIFLKAIVYMIMNFYLVSQLKIRFQLTPVPDSKNTQKVRGAKNI